MAKAKLWPVKRPVKKKAVNAKKTDLANRLKKATGRVSRRLDTRMQRFSKLIAIQKEAKKAGINWLGLVGRFSYPAAFCPEFSILRCYWRGGLRAAKQWSKSVQETYDPAKYEGRLKSLKKSGARTVIIGSLVRPRRAAIEMLEMEINHDKGMIAVAWLLYGELERAAKQKV